MKGYSNELIKEIKDRTDILDIVGEYTDLAPSAGNYKAFCPFHDDSTPSMVVYPHTQSYYCFGCGAGSKDEGGSSDVIAFLMAKEGWSFADTVDYLAKKAGVTLSTGEVPPEILEARALREEVIKNNRQYYLSLRKNNDALSYLSDRGVSNSMIEQYRIGYVSKTNKIAICIFNERGDSVAFAYRKLGEEDGPKYINDSDSIIFKKSKILYGLNFAKPMIKSYGALVLVEGYFDVIALQEKDIPAVAIMSTRVSDDQINLIKKYTNTVILFLDDDEAGQAGTLKNISRLRNAGLIVKVTKPYMGLDPDELARHMGSALNRYIEVNTVMAGQYIISRVLRTYESITVEQRVRTIMELRDALQCIPAGVERNSYISQIASVFNMPYDAIARELRVNDP